jgi:CheY-like chemotaxis protein
MPIKPALTAEKRIIRTIALIDDDDDDEYFLRRVLAKARIGCHVLRFLDGKEGIDYFHREGRFEDRVAYPECDLVLLDINMPVANGFDVLNWLRLHPPTPEPALIVMLSSSSNPKDVSDALRLGAKEYATKPPTTGMFEELAEKYSAQWEFLRAP